MYIHVHVYMYIHMYMYLNLNALWPLNYLEVEGLIKVNMEILSQRTEEKYVCVNVLEGKSAQTFYTQSMYMYHWTL